MGTATKKRGMHFTLNYNQCLHFRAVPNCCVRISDTIAAQRIFVCEHEDGCCQYTNLVACLTHLQTGMRIINGQEESEAY